MIDWQRVCMNLRREYKTLSAIGRELKIDWQVIHRLARGDSKQPRFDTGMKLLDLHLDKCPDKHNMEVIRWEM